MRTLTRWSLVAAMTTTLTLLASSRLAATAAAAGCQLPQTSGRGIKHVIYAVWDNTHLLRDNPNVPSDSSTDAAPAEFPAQQRNRALKRAHAARRHTANDIVTAETGLYPDRHGLSISNGYGYLNSNGSISFPSAFTYWTDPVQTTGTPNPPYNLITPLGKNAPAPWVPYTRAGCNVGAIASGDIALENMSTAPSGDITRIFGTKSPYWKEAVKENAKGAPQGLAPANFEGLAIHCAKVGSVCGGGEPDALPSEPGGYSGFKGLFGALQINPLLTGQPVKTVGGYKRSPSLKGLDGKPITDSNNPANGGFPGFDGMNPNASLAFVASMQEHGVPVNLRLPHRRPRQSNHRQRVGPRGGRLWRAPASVRRGVCPVLRRSRT